MSHDPNTVWNSLALSFGSGVVGYWLAVVRCELRRMRTDLDVARARDEAEDEALARLRTTLGRRRGRRSGITPQSR